MTGRRWTALRWVFVVAVVAGIWWSWRSSGGEVARALEDVSVWRVVAGGVLVVCGLLLTGLVWVQALGSVSTAPRPRDALPPFFVAQLGKYIPGSVWSFTAQGVLGAAQGLPARVPATAALLFLGVHVASGLLLVGVLGWWTELPRLLVAASLLAGVVGLAPAGYRFLGSRLSGRTCRWTVSRSAAGGLLMVPVWTCYALALTVLVPAPDAALALGLGCSFALAFAIGVAVPIAPAGLGARDGVLALLVAPLVGTGPATAIVLLGRLVHTVADLALGAIGWWLLHRSGSAPASGRGREPH